MSAPDVDQFLIASSNVLRDMLSTLSAELEVHVRSVSIAYVWDVQTRSFGWRVNIEDGETWAYAFDTNMVRAIDKLAHGWKRLRAGELPRPTSEPHRLH